MMANTKEKRNKIGCVQQNEREFMAIDNTHIFITKDADVAKYLSKRKKYEDYGSAHLNKLISNLDYSDAKEVKISVEHLWECIKVARKLKIEALTISVKPNFPLKAGCKEFNFILAPRISED